MGTQKNVTDNTNPKLDIEDDVIHMFTNNMNLTWCSQVTVVDVEQNPRGRHASSFFKIVCNRSLSVAYGCSNSKIQYIRVYIWEYMCTS